MKKLFLIAFAAGALQAQNSLRISGGEAPAGGTAQLTLSFTTPYLNVAGLQWDVVLPYLYTFQGATTIPNAKLTCHAQTCILVGAVPGPGLVIPSGTTVASLAVKIPRTASGDAVVRIANSIEAFANAAGLQVGGSSATIRILPGQCTECAVLTGPAESKLPVKTKNASLFGIQSPRRQDSGPDAAVEIGVVFSARMGGKIAAVRFFKSPGNGGKHVVHLWSGSGKPLATAVAMRESPSGWQVVKFPAPVPISAETTYVASYSCPSGHYAADEGGFKSKLEAGILSAPANAGVFAYGLGKFPNTAFHANNYWVDVVFDGDEPELSR